MGPSHVAAVCFHRLCIVIVLTILKNIISILWDSSTPTQGPSLPTRTTLQRSALPLLLLQLTAIDPPLLPPAVISGQSH